MPSSPDPRSPIFFEILCGLLLSSWPKASDEADGNTGRPQPGFFRITGKKYFVLYLRWLGEGNFLVQILCGGSVIGIRLILHQLPLPRKSLKRGKIILVSTSWWEVANQYGIRFTVRILGGITHYLSLSLCLSPLNVPKTGFPWSIPLI